MLGRSFHMLSGMILRALAALILLAAPVSAEAGVGGVWRFDITGQDSIGDPFRFTIVYDTARAPAPVPANVGGFPMFRYSASGILWTSLTVGGKTWDKTHLPGQVLYFNTDVDQARPTTTTFAFIDFADVSHLGTGLTQGGFDAGWVTDSSADAGLPAQLTATRLVPTVAWDFENPPFVAGAVSGQQGWVGNGLVENFNTGPDGGAQHLHLNASSQYISAERVMNIAGAGETLTIVADFLRNGGSAAGGISVNGETGPLAQIAGGPSYYIGGASNFSNDRDFADGVWHRLALTIDFAAGKLGGAVDGVDLGTIPWTNPTPPTRLTLLNLFSYNINPLQVYFDNVAVLVPQARNDDCAAAAAVGLGTTNFNTRAATTDGLAATECAFCCGDSQINQDIWYSFVSPGTGLTTIETCGSSFNTKLAVYAGTCGSLGSSLACNDNTPSCFGGGTATGSRVTFVASAGQVYLIRVGGYPNLGAVGVMNISQVPTVPCWTQVQPAVNPPARREASMTFDAVRGKAVLACGISDDILSDTWTFNGQNWSPAGSIQSRGAAPMSFHAGIGKSVLYSGYGTNSQTMEFDGSLWADVSSAVGTPTPPVFFWHSTAYDAPRGRLVLFGGTDYGGFVSNQTWMFNGSAWSPQAIAGPSARTRSGLVADTSRNVLVLFGGADLFNTAFNDTWEYDGSAWTQRTPGASPPARYGHAMVYDSRLQRTIVIGGKATDGSVLNDAWAYDGTTWSALSILGSGPTSRYYQSMAHDSTRMFDVVFGGFNSSDVPQGDTWLLSVGPAIAAAPVGGQLCRGSNRTLSVVVHDPAATFQWRKGGIDIAGATSSSLVVQPGAAGAGVYDCRVFTACGMATSSAAALTWCAADFNCSGVVTVQDIFEFLAGYFSGDPRADFNQSGAITVQDIFDFLAAYFAGC